jgi:nicotinate-nucleotide adenylyltransferase
METNKEKVFESIRREVVKYESEKRYRHTLSVYEESAALAKLFNLSDSDSFALEKAALVHDITKDFSGEKQLELCSRYGIRTDKKPDDPMPVMHQYTGAEFARELFGKDIIDDTVFSAVGCDTTGKVGMSLVDKLLFIADFIEPTRQYESCKELRRAFYNRCEDKKDNTDALAVVLDETIQMCIENTIVHLLQRRMEIEENVIPLWNSLLKSGGQNNGS